MHRGASIINLRPGISGIFSPVDLFTQPCCRDASNINGQVIHRHENICGGCDHCCPCLPSILCHHQDAVIGSSANIPDITTQKTDVIHIVGEGFDDGPLAMALKTTEQQEQ